MMTHVKKNAQNANYTTSSHVHCAITFKGVESRVNCSGTRQASLKEDIILSQYLIQREEECRRYLFGGL